MPYTFNPFTGGLDGAGAGGFADAPSDGVLRARKNKFWSTIDAADIPGLPPNGLDMTLIEATDGLYGYIGDIGVDQFNGETSLTGLYLGNSVTSIGSQAFDNCSGFTGSLTIPNNVTSISTAAFRSCSGFTGSLILGSGLTSIGSYAFYNCNFTGSLTIPNSVTTIGSYAFYYCSGMGSSLTIPNSATTIGDRAFCGCQSITDVYLNQPLSSVDSYAFVACEFSTIHLRPSPNTPAGWTIGGDQTIGGKSGVTVVANWTTYPNSP